MSVKLCALVVISALVMQAVRGGMHSNVSVIVVPVATPVPTRNASAPSNHLSVTWNVECGNGGRCSDAFPICCGVNEDMFCVSAGDKCCQSEENPKKYTSCAPYETCCANSEGVECCGVNQTCDYSKGYRCSNDPCRQLPDPDACVLGNNNCGWDCYHQVCISQNMTRGNLLIYPGETCDDPCQYATTCERCGEIRQNVPQSGCAWCCQSQTCGNELNQDCDIKQQISYLFDGRCPRCNFGGTGLHIVDDGPAGYQMMLMAVVGVSLTVCMGFVLKLALLRRQRLAMAEFAALDADAPADPQASVIKYGFKRSRKAEEGPGAQRDDETKKKKRNKKKKNETQASHGASVTRPARSGSGLEHELQRSTTDASAAPDGAAAASSSSGSSSSDESDSSSVDTITQAKLDETNPFLNDALTKKCRERLQQQQQQQQQQQRAVHGDDHSDDDRNSEEAARERDSQESPEAAALPDVVLLPCGHFYCFPPAPPLSVESAATSSSSRGAAVAREAGTGAAAAAPAVVSTASQTVLSSPLEQLPLRICPECRAVVETPFYPAKVIR